MNNEELILASKKSLKSKRIGIILFNVAYWLCILFVPFFYKVMPDGSENYITILETFIKVCQGKSEGWEEGLMVAVPLFTHGALMFSLALNLRGISVLNLLQQKRLGFNIKEIYGKEKGKASIKLAIFLFIISSILIILSCVGCSTYLGLAKLIVKPESTYIYSPYQLFFIAVIFIYAVLQFINLIVLHSLLDRKSVDEIDPDLF